MKPFTVIVCLIMVWIAGCSPSITTQPAISPLAPSETMSVATSTPVSTPTKEVISTLQSMPTLAIAEKCMKVEDLPVDLTIPGLWLIGRANPYLQEIATGKKIGISLKGTNVLPIDFEGYAVSPNREWFAYIDQYIDGSAANKRILRIIHSSGQSLSMDDWQENFQWIIGWVDDEHIALELNKTSVTHQKIVILNPFSGDFKEITPEWIKDYHDLDPYWIQQIYYSPDVTRAVVIVVLNGKYELKDIQTSSTLFQGEHINAVPYLAWSSDSSKLALVENGNRYLYIIPKSEKLTKLNYEDFDTISRFSEVWWSPNGHKLLFDSGGPYVFDLELSKVTKLCFEDKIMWTRYGGTLWSPDNQFIVLNASQYDDSGGWLDFGVLIDIKEMHAYKLPQMPIHHERLAWLAMP
jgi:hypothetical protein